MASPDQDDPFAGDLPVKAAPSGPVVVAAPPPAALTSDLPSPATEDPFAGDLPVSPVSDAPPARATATVSDHTLLGLPKLTPTDMPLDARLGAAPPPAPMTL